MLMYKNDDSFGTAIRHLGHAVPSIASRLSAELLLPTVKNYDTEKEINDIIENYNKQFRAQLLKIGEQAINGGFAAPELLPVRASTLLSEYVMNVATALYNKFNEQISPEFDQALSTFASALNAISAQQFIDESRARRFDKLADLIENRRLSAWATVFARSEWRENAIKNELERHIPEIVADNIDDSGSSDAKEVTDMSTSEIDEFYFHEYLSSELTTTAHDKLVANDDASQLIGTVPEVVSNTSRRLRSFVEKTVFAEAEKQLSDYNEDNLDRRDF